MDGGFVLAARFRVGATEGHVHRAADLLIEERVLREALDAVVRPEGEFADAARARIGIQQFDEIILPTCGGRLRDDAVLKGEADVLDLAPAEVRGIGEVDVAVDARPRPGR